MKIMSTYLPLFLVLLLISPAWTLDNGAALLPPLVVTTQLLGCNINENSLRNIIDQIIELGLKRAGFDHLLIYDCWQGERDKSSGEMVEDKSRFPSGLSELIKYAHDRNLKIGLGTDIGPTTSQNKQGSLNHESTDALTYARWKVDMVWLGNSNNLPDYRQKFIVMSQFLQKNGRVMTISVDLKDSEQARWARTIANTWTVSRINIDKWSSLTKVLMEMVSKEDYTGTGAWNDAGILNLNLPTSEFLVQLGLWMGLKAPIWFPAPLDNLNTTKLSYFLNDELVSLSQDPLRKPVILLRHDEFAQGVQEVWGGWLTSNRFVLLFMNGLSTAAPMNISLTKEAKIPDLFSYSIRDPVMRRNIGSSSNEEVRVASVAGHSLEIRVLHF